LKNGFGLKLRKFYLGSKCILATYQMVAISTDSFEKFSCCFEVGGHSLEIFVYYK